jgi:hypothetical protein
VSSFILTTLARNASTGACCDCRVDRRGHYQRRGIDAARRAQALFVPRTVVLWIPR